MCLTFVLFLFEAHFRKFSFVGEFGIQFKMTLKLSLLAMALVNNLHCQGSNLDKTVFDSNRISLVAVFYMTLNFCEPNIFCHID